ncbi:MFS transporter (plasmid) [Comamonas sp. C11]|nr:MFS transporter [Comamonas sp. C11]UUC96760.1 MFS transporter [Comamonas sp. C11]
MISKRWVVQILITGAMLGIIQQFAGINSIMYYGGKIIQESGFNPTVAAILNAGNGFLSIVGAVLGMFTIDWLGRRKLEFAGLTICGITLVAAGVISLDGAKCRLGWYYDRCLGLSLHYFLPRYFRTSYLVDQL